MFVKIGDSLVKVGEVTHVTHNDYNHTNIIHLQNGEKFSTYDKLPAILEKLNAASNPSI